MVLNMARAAPEQTGNSPQLSSSAADFQRNTPNQALSQEETRASEFTCASIATLAAELLALRRAEVSP